MKKVTKSKKFSLDEDLEELMDEAAQVEGTASKVEVKDTEAKDKEPIVYEILEDDNDIKASLKEYINQSGLTLQDMYDKIGQTNGYNMFYRLKEKGQLGLKSINKWCDILGVVPYLAFRAQTEEERDEAEKAFKIEKEQSIKNKNKRK
jgi:hypothetical protein